MSPYDAEGVNSRFESLEYRMNATQSDVGDLRSEHARVLQEVIGMTDSFRALRTALYTAAGTIAAAAMIVVLHI
jgi:hypothetical protein